MSQLVTYIEPSIYDPMSKLITFINPVNLDNLYTFKLCCDKTNLYLPNDIWKLIIYDLCHNLTVPVEPIKILEWLDDYITNPLQQKLNPILLGHDHSINNIVPTLYLLADRPYQPIQMSYGIETIKLENNQCQLSRHVDFFIGIVKNELIKTINIHIKQWIPPEWFAPEITLTYTQKDLHEFQFQNVYSHLQEEIIDNPSNLLQEKYKNTNQIIYWTMRDIFPFSHINSLRIQITFTFETENPLTQVEFLYAFLNEPIRGQLQRGQLQDDRCLRYKKMIYFDGMFYQHEQ